jgi:hypothetical protein
MLCRMSLPGVLGSTRASYDMPIFTWDTWEVRVYSTIGVGYFLDIPAKFGHRREADTFDPYIPSPTFRHT